MGFLRKLRRSKELSVDDKLGLVWVMHFGFRDPEEVTCSDCEDFRAGLCEGGVDVVDCMFEKAQNIIVWSS